FCCPLDRPVAMRVSTAGSTGLPIKHTTGVCFFRYDFHRNGGGVMKRTLIHCVALLGLAAGARNVAQAQDPSAMRKEIVSLTNSLRQQHGVSALSPSFALMTDAQRYALLMAAKDTMAHKLDGQDTAQRLAAEHYPALNVAPDHNSWGENIARW